jgi:hypothetical protein
VNAFAKVAEPARVVTTTSTVPAARAGVNAYSSVPPIMKYVAAVPPKVMDWVESRFVPVMDVPVPPDAEPVVIDSELTVGAG